MTGIVAHFGWRVQAWGVFFAPMMTSRPSETVESWSCALREGSRAALARAITLVENDAPQAGDVMRAARMLTGHALVVGITGAPGAGKSTLVGAFVGELRRRGQSVGVLAVDPSSPVTGGALLGDRIRMLSHAGDAGVFVRSLASRGHLGGLARSAGSVVDVMDASGCDVVIIETVGVGQSEIEVTDLADVRIVAWAPGAGDDVQAAKAGILEIADILVVNKADLPQAAAAEAALRIAASYGSRNPPSVMRTIATNSHGVPELADMVMAVGRHSKDDRITGAHKRLQRQIVEAVAEQTRSRARNDSRLTALCDAVRGGDLEFDEAVLTLLEQPS